MDSGSESDSDGEEQKGMRFCVLTCVPCDLSKLHSFFRFDDWPFFFIIIIDNHLCWSKITIGDREIQNFFLIHHVKIHSKHIQQGLFFGNNT